MSRYIVPSERFYELYLGDFRVPVCVDLAKEASILCVVTKGRSEMQMMLARRTQIQCTSVRRCCLSSDLVLKCRFVVKDPSGLVFQRNEPGPEGSWWLLRGWPGLVVRNSAGSSSCGDSKPCTIASDQSQYAHWLSEPLNAHKNWTGVLRSVSSHRLHYVRVPALRCPATRVSGLHHPATHLAHQIFIRGAEDRHLLP